MLSLADCLVCTVRPGVAEGRTLLSLPKPQQMTTFRSVISLGSIAGLAIHFSTIKGQRSLCRAAVPPLQGEESRRQGQGMRAAGTEALSWRSGGQAAVALAAHVLSCGT